jgi:SPP1 gp7 family putative phage head morphogenesis protein
MQIALRHLVGGYSHAQALRKRTRILAGTRPSKQNELWYKAKLLALVKEFRGQVEPLVSSLKPVGDGLARDDASNPINAMLDKLAKEFAQRVEGPAERLSKEAAFRGLTTSDERLRNAIKRSVSVDLGASMRADGVMSHVLAAAIDANTRLIKSIHSQYLELVGDRVAKSLEGGARWETLIDEIKRLGDVTESRAALIARDQTSKMNGAFTAIRQQSLGIKKFKWQTADDEQVRDEHDDLNGEEFEWSDPPSEGLPGQPVNCRCIALPVVDLDEAGDVESGQPSFFGTVQSLAIAGSFFGNLSNL